MISIPIGTLAALYVALRLSAVPGDAEARQRQADLAIALLPFSMRQRLALIAVEQLRRTMGSPTH